MASRCRPFTPAPYTPNIRLIWWYTPCLSLTFTVRPSGVRASTSAGERAVPSASVTPLFCKIIPVIADGAVVYVNHDPVQSGDVGIFCVDGDMLCKQYYRDPLGVVYLFSLNRRRADADVILPPSSGRSLTCFGRVMRKRSLPPSGVEMSAPITW